MTGELSKSIFSLRAKKSLFKIVLDIEKSCKSIFLYDLCSAKNLFNDKKTKTQKHKKTIKTRRQKTKKAKRQKDKMTRRQEDKKDKKTRIKKEKKEKKIVINLAMAIHQMKL